MEAVQITRHLLGMLASQHSVWDSVVLTVSTTLCKTTFTGWKHFGDPTFQYQAAMSKIWGMLALQLANADILPFDYETYATDLMTPLKLLQNSGSEKQNR